MIEVASASVDLIYTSPPYNIGTIYAEFQDEDSLVSYQQLLNKVFNECSRVIKNDGILILECADSVSRDGTFIQLAGYIQSLCINLGFILKERHVNFVNTREGKELTEHNWDSDYSTKANAHSNCHQILIFSKSSKTKFNSLGEVHYINYRSDDNHPCPIPGEMINFIIKRFFQPGMIVADPFMGTALLGAEVLRKGGIFIGYEVAPSIFKLAQEHLSRV